MMVGLGILNVRTGPSCLRSKLDRHGVLELGLEWLEGWVVLASVLFSSLVVLSSVDLCRCLGSLSLCRYVLGVYVWVCITLIGVVEWLSR